MSYELERAVERAIERLRGLANSYDEDDNFFLVQKLRQVAADLEQPLTVAQQARQRDERRHAATTMTDYPEGKQHATEI